MKKIKYPDNDIAYCKIDNIIYYKKDKNHLIYWDNSEPTGIPKLIKKKTIDEILEK